MLGIVLAAMMQAAPAAAEVRSAEADSRTLTIYRDDLAFVTEEHVMDVPAGRTRVVFGGVNDRMVPQTAVLTGFRGVTLERNFDQGLLTKASLFASLVGERAVLMRTNPGDGDMERIEAQVLSAGRGVVLRTPAGVETLECTGLPQSLAAPERPEDLLSVPELSVVVEAEAAGPATFRLSYLARGIGWSADYVLTVPQAVGEGDSKEAEADLRAWLTFTNETADSFDGVPAAIIAGTLQQTGETEAPEPNAPGYYAACWPQGTTTDIPLRRAENPYLLGFPSRSVEGAPVAFEADVDVSTAFSPNRMAEASPRARTATEERFGDYRLYRPPGPITLTPYRTKQVAFLDEGGVGISRRYDFDLRPYRAETGEVLTPRALYLIDNEAGGTLARALPAGTVRVMTTASGEAFYLGQDQVRDLAVGLPVEIEAGGAPDVSARVETTKRGRRGSVVEVMLANAAPAPAPVRVTLTGWGAERGDASFSGEGDARVEGEPSPTWDVAVPANGTRTLRLRAAYR